MDKREAFKATKIAFECGMPMPFNLLFGVRVLEYASLACGPFCGKVLADLGADVIKVELPGSGDEARRRGPFLEDEPNSEASVLFLALNTNKRGVTLDVATPDGRDIFLDLIRWADVLVEDKAPGFWRDLDLPFERLHEANRQLVVTSITPYGQTGPHSNYRAYPLNVEHAGGGGYLAPNGRLSWETSSGRPPVKQGAYIMECEIGLNAATGTIAAVFARRLSGIGQQVDFSKQESQISTYRLPIDRYDYDGAVPERLSIGFGPLGMLPGKDGWTLPLLLEHHMWESLARLMGSPDWTQEEWFDDPMEIRERADFINEKVSEWLLEQPVEQFYHAAQEGGAAVGTVVTAKDLVESDQLKARNFFRPTQHPVVGRHLHPTIPINVSEQSYGESTAAPLLGQDNEGVYCDLLDYTAPDLVRLRQAGVV